MALGDGVGGNLKNVDPSERALLIDALVNGLSERSVWNITCNKILVSA